MFWIGLAPLLLLWIVSGLVAQRGGYERSASVATGRLGMGVSLCAFVVVTMALWALLSNAARPVAEGRGLPAGDLSRASAGRRRQSTAQLYLQHRYVGSTETFAPLAILLLTLLGFAVVTLFPSVLAELAVMREQGPRAGRGRRGERDAGVDRAALARSSTAPRPCASAAG